MLQLWMLLHSQFIHCRKKSSQKIMIFQLKILGGVLLLIL
ncbi:hypothetical protein ECDEC1B_5319 [Escherichia coli DEC1B]|nr:hypothetical protein ECDEC1B_5319 [Escherichia coli DEC1B]